MLWFNIHSASKNTLYDPDQGVSLSGSAEGLSVRLPPDLGGFEEIVSRDGAAICPCCEEIRRCLVLSTVTVTACPRPEGSQFFWSKKRRDDGRENSDSSED